MSKKTLILIAATLVVIAVATWRAGSYPAQLIVMNQAGRALQEIVVECGDQRQELGTMRNGETRIIKLEPGEPVVLTYRGGTRWQSPQPLRPARGQVLFIGVDRVELELAVKRGAD
ncbi:MAG TPA: hypothetical protein VF111_00745 [Thermoanaerobaculia bacterium]